MPSLNFYIQSKKSPATIYVRLRDGKIDAKARTELLIDPNNWSSTKRQPKALKDPNSKMILSKIKEIELSVLDKFNMERDRASINTDWLYSAIQKMEVNSALPNKILAYFDLYFNEKKEDGAKENYLKKVKSIKNLVSRFLKNKKGINDIIDVDINWADSFVRFMRKEGYNQSYIFRSLKFVKSVCIHARNKGVPTSVSLPSIKTKDNKAIKTYLNPSELEMIENVVLPTESLENARDWLIISCYLGQRVSDLMRCHSSLIIKKDNGMVIDLRQKKTDNPIYIGILPEVKPYLEKRNGEFPRAISDQNYNLYIKEVGRLAGLHDEELGSVHDKESNRDVIGMYPKWQLITSHVGRRSFATNYYNKYPISLLMAQTGHKSERSFLDYIGKGRMDQINSFLDEVNKNRQKDNI